MVRLRSSTQKPQLRRQTPNSQPIKPQNRDDRFRITNHRTGKIQERDDRVPTGRKQHGQWQLCTNVGTNAIEL